MKSLIAFVSALALSGCAAYRVSPEDKPLRADGFASLRIVKENQDPEGVQRIEPLLFLLTLGIIPTHCYDTYNVSLFSAAESAQEAKYRVTSIGGWVALIVSPLPGWHHGNPENIEEKIEKLVRKTRK